MAACFARKRNFICLISFVILLDISCKLSAQAVTADSASPSVCVGTQESEFTTSDSIGILKMMRKSLEGCQSVIGDIHIIRINEKDFIDAGKVFDLSFLDSIREVTGCIKIVDSCFDTPISFKSLQVIRGLNCAGNAVTIHYIETCTMKVPPIDFRSLRYIGKGDVLVGGLKDCFIENHINFKEIFADNRNQKLVSKLNCLQQKDSKCDSSCELWSDKNRYCWGPGPDQCQRMSKCRSSIDCPSRRCFVDLSKIEHCCPENCLGGCYGTTSKQCYGCTEFNKDGTCVGACSPATGKKYDRANARLVDSLEKYYPLGHVCVAKCPSSFFIEENSCVSKCSTGYSANANKICVKKLASRHCEGGKVALLCDENNPLIVSLNNASQLCTEFTGDISILNECFSAEKRPSRTKKLNIKDLTYIFSRLTIVRGSITVSLSTPEIISLSFLSNLQKIDSNPKSTGSGSLTVNSNSIQYLGLSSLHHVAGGIYVTPFPHTSIKEKNFPVNFCPAFFPTENAVIDGILEHPHSFPTKYTAIFLKRVSTKFYKAMCPTPAQKCHKECDPLYGCWGPLASHCVKCLNVRVGSECSLNCISVSGWFNESKSKVLGKNATENICTPCSKLCSSCYGTDDNKCTNCISSAYRDNSQCVKNCSPDNQYADTNRVCQPCPNVCLKPSNNASTCTGNESYVGPGGCQLCTLVILEEKSDNKNVLRCLSSGQECPPGHYLVVLENSHVSKFPDFFGILTSSKLQASICLKCANECSLCRGVADSCLDCRYFRIQSESKVLSNAKLICTKEPLCPKGFYPDEEKKVCKPCSEVCSECVGPADSDCTKCSDRMYTSFRTDVKNNSQLACVSSCPDTHPHKDLRTGFGMICSSSPPAMKKEVEMGSVKESRQTVVIVGIIACVTLFMLLFLFVFCYWLQQRNLHAKKCIRKRIIGWDEDMEPLNLTDAAPNVAVLRTISEKEIVRGPEIGSGAFGTVFRADWLPEGENRKVSVAIKILSDSLGECNVSSELLEESRIMASVEHPHCVRLFGICMTQPLQLITQFMPLGNLRDFLRARKDTDQIGSSHLLRYASQIASGMSYLEHRSIIHRDLACRNVLVASNKCVKITDFGLAKLLDNPNEEYKASGGKLPVKWLALECLVSRKFSHKSDVWAYGVTLWEIFTFGDAPYVNVKPNDLADYLEKGERLPQPPICTLDVYIVMIKCWMLNESQRPTFDDLEAGFKKMALDPGRYVYIKGDKYARNPSNESGSTEHRSACSSVSPSVHQLPSDQQIVVAQTDPEDCNYSALDASELDSEVFRSEPGHSVQPTSVASTSQQPHPYAGHSISESNNTAAAAAVPSTSGPSFSNQSRTYNKGSQKYMNVKKIKLLSHNDNTYTSDPCKVPLEEHQMTPRMMSRIESCDAPRSATAFSDDEYLKPIGMVSSTADQIPDSTYAPHCNTSTVQNPEYFFNACRRQYHNVSLAGQGAAGLTEVQGAARTSQSPQPSARPLQLLVTASQGDIPDNAENDSVHLSYV